MRIVNAPAREEIATVHVIDVGEGRLVECVESTQPPLTRDQKWVLIVSVLSGCPVKCLMCDAGGHYQGKLSAEQIFQQIDCLIRSRYPDGVITTGKLKIQFARMGEPALNPAVIEVLDRIQDRYCISNFVPSVSTIAPAGSEDFFERLLEVKRRRYGSGRFQLQFSIHTTDEVLRDRLVPVKKWSFPQISEYGSMFHRVGDQKITLNFALVQGMPVESAVLLQYFSPEKFILKITPINPTRRASENGLVSYIDAYEPEREYELVESLRSAGYEVILSIGEVEENRIGSNCGQYVMSIPGWNRGTRIPDQRTDLEV